MATVMIPAKFEDFTPEWMTRALRGQIGGATVTSVAVQLVGQGVGILCQLARLTLGYDAAAHDAPASVIAKIPTADAQTRGMADAFRFYEREVRFYRELQADISVRTPRCWFNVLDDAGNFVLLLEDLGARRIGDQVAGCSADDAKLAVYEIAKVHAQWWNHPRLNELAWVPESSSEINKMGLRMYPMAWKLFMERMGHALPEQMIRTGEKLGAYTDTILDQFAIGVPHTLLHGDYRLDNFFFAGRPGDEPLAVLDWQIAMRGVGTYDVGYMLTQSVAIDVRRAIEHDLLRDYHRILVENGVKDYSLDDCINHYRWTALGCWVYPVMGGGLADLANARGLALATAMMHRSAAAIMDWNAAELLDTL
ncbi:MAG: phosphotransferase [Dehalococcoidia bacterium]